MSLFFAEFIVYQMMIAFSGFLVCCFAALYFVGKIVLF